MGLTGTKTFVGFGFGAIQSGLFLHEAFESGNFGRFVIAEVMPAVVDEIRQAGGMFTVNIAHADHIQNARIGPVEILNPAVPEDQQQLIQAIAEASEIATAIPSVKYFATDAEESLHRVLAAGLREKLQGDYPRAVIYTAENNNHAAEILQGHVLDVIPTEEHEKLLKQAQFLNTVVGKMSGVISDTDNVLGQPLANVTEESTRTFLVEAFNKILITQITLDDFQRGITVFEEKADLYPFEEAKLYGHNATHALGAYLAHTKGLEFIAQIREVNGMMDMLRDAFVNESGGALTTKYAGVDPLFTEQGYADYVDDLLVRMTNPYLRDTVARVGRDPGRKLGWDDRLIGTMRLALNHGIEPAKYAMGAAAALVMLDDNALNNDVAIADMLLPLWESAAPDSAERDKVIQWVERGRNDLRAWLA